MYNSLHAERAEYYEAQSDAKIVADRFCDFCDFCVKKTVSYE